MKRQTISYAACLFGIMLLVQARAEYPCPVENPQSTMMLAGDWFDDPQAIDFERLPRVPSEHVVISDVTVFPSPAINSGVNQHGYLTHYDGRFWAMWSDGPGWEDLVGQRVAYAVSEDGLNWSEKKFITDYPPDSGPDSPHYRTRHIDGFRYIARGFWEREGEFLALLTIDEARGHFGPGLTLLAYRWDPERERWEEKGVVFENAINNFEPKRLPTGEWMMSRRDHRFRVSFLVGGVDAFDAWTAHPVRGEGGGAVAMNEPHWSILPDGNLVALFRQGNFLNRSFSTDNGRTWSPPVVTDFPDANSKFFKHRLSDGRYLLVSNPRIGPPRRDPMTIAISDDGLVYDRLFWLIGGRWVDYPHVLEHDGYLYIQHTGHKRTIEVHRIKIEDLDKLEMQDARLSVEVTETPTRKTEMEIDGMPIQVEVHGSWGQSGRSDERFADAYYFMRPNGHGTVRFIPELPKAGRYRVDAWWNTQGTRFAAVPYVITHADGAARVIVDQRRDGGKWMELGTFSFTSENAAVEVRAEGFNNYLVADVVRFVSME